MAGNARLPILQGSGLVVGMIVRVGVLEYHALARRLADGPIRQGEATILPAEPVNRPSRGINANTGEEIPQPLASLSARSDGKSLVEQRRSDFDAITRQHRARHGPSVRALVIVAPGEQQAPIASPIVASFGEYVERPAHPHRSRLAAVIEHDPVNGCPEPEGHIYLRPILGFLSHVALVFRLSGVVRALVGGL